MYNVFPFAVVCLTQLKYTDGAADVKSKYAGGFKGLERKFCWPV